MPKTFIGCTDKYVAICFRRLNIFVGRPAPTAEELSRKSVNPVPGWRETIAKPVPFKPKQFQNQHCRKLSYFDGALRYCGEPTRGHTYCSECAHGLVAMFDPPPRSTPTSAEAA